MFKINYLGLLAVGVLLAISSCKKASEVAPDVDNEAITTVRLKLTNNANPADIVVGVWEQLTPTNPATIDISGANLRLRANAVYSGELEILDKTQKPTADISADIAGDEAVEHLLFYQPTPVSSLNVSNTTPDIPNTPTVAAGSPVLNLRIARTDRDKNSLQLGLKTTFTTGAASTGKLKVVLRHQPDTKNGTYGVGSSDFDIDFMVTIQ